jgi:hypothetical protein
MSEALLFDSGSPEKFTGVIGSKHNPANPEATNMPFSRPRSEHTIPG